jgi:hypothetical protein
MRQTKVIKAQTGVRKSIALDPDEMLKLENFGSEYDTQQDKANKLGISRGALIRVLHSGSGRGDTIRILKNSLKKVPLPKHASC